MANLDLAGIITRVCTDLKTKFSKVTFSKYSSGFNITVDGTSHSVGIPAPSPIKPSMDGAAFAGSVTEYARADHVHPTDTSRQATLVSGTNIKTVNSTSLLGSGNVEVQQTLVSGTNIKTINGNSLLGSGNLVISGGGGSSQWTDISSLEWTFSEEDVASIHAETNGSLVCLSAAVSAVDLNESSFGIYPPSGYEPSYISTTQFTSDNHPDVFVGNVVALTSGEIYMFLTEPDLFSIEELQNFTIIYPIA